MYEEEVVRELHQLAMGRPDRKAVLDARKTRESSRSRRLTCPTCMKVSGYSTRGKDDVCPFCLRDMWQGADAIALANQVKAGEGLVPFMMTAGDHNLPYPHIHWPGMQNVPIGAVFDRSDPDRRHSGESPARTLQALFGEFMEEMAKCYPVATDARKDALVFLRGSTMWRSDARAAYLPARVVKTMEDLWCFAQWLAHMAYRSGLEQGTDLLGQLNAGTLPQQKFDDELNKQRSRILEAALEAAAGYKGSNS